MPVYERLPSTMTRRVEAGMLPDGADGRVADVDTWVSFDASPRSAPPAMSELDLITSIALGIGLAGAVGFRVFIPLMIISLAAYSGHLHLNDSFAWLATLPALLMLSVAAIVEVLAYYIPGVDNLLDAVAAPMALLAGTVVMAAVIGDVPPLVRWTTAVIAGGGAAGLTQGLTTLLRAKSTAATGGLGNSVIATGELSGALVGSIVALLWPIVAVAVFALFALLAVRLALRLRARRR